jgi:tRNA(Ile)-lysidine synthase
MRDHIGIETQSACIGQHATHHTFTRCDISGQAYDDFGRGHCDLYPSVKYTPFQTPDFRECYNEFMFHQDLALASLEKCRVNKDEPLLLGVSGGADSLALLHGLHHLGFNLIVAHLDHGLRAESAQEAVFVARIAEAMTLPFVQERVDVEHFAANASESLEEAARNVRYHFLLHQARRYGAQAVAVAHHADDQVETVLMHFLRGAALSGLSGMAYRRVIPIYDPEIPIVRPMLGIWRSEIEAYLAEVGVTPCVDESNADITFFRNRLRHVLIPELETYNPQFRNVVLRMADVLGEEDGFLDDLTEVAWARCLEINAEDQVVLNVSEFKQLQKAIQRRVLRFAIRMLRPDLRDVDYDAIERGLDFVMSPPESREIDFVSRLNLVLVQDNLIIKTWSAELPRWDLPLLPTVDFTSQLNVGESIVLDAGWSLHTELLVSLPEDVLDWSSELDPYEAWLDYDRLHLPLTLRGRKTGDTWQPLGMKGHTQKISDFYINEKIPEHLRDIWPLVTSADAIAWVVGMRPSERFKITVDTQRILALKVIRSD